MKKIVLILAAHPDDEVIGCGASIARFIQEGHSVSVLHYGEGPTSRGSQNNAKNEAEKAAKVLGFNLLDSLDLEDQKFDQYPFLEIAKKTSELVQKINPSIIFTHHPRDLNMDHRIVSEAACVATRSTPECKIEEVYFWENLSSFEWSPHRHEFRHQLYIDVTKTIDQKILALKAYQSEIRNFPHPRSAKALQALATLRGSESGFEAAESFEIFRIRRGQSEGVR